MSGGFAENWLGHDFDENWGCRACGSSWADTVRVSGGIVCRARPKVEVVTREEALRRIEKDMELATGDNYHWEAAWLGQLAAWLRTKEGYIGWIAWPNPVDQVVREVVVDDAHVMS